MFNPTAIWKKWLATSTLRQKLAAGLLLFSLLATGALSALGGSTGTSSNPAGLTPFYFLSVFVKLAGVLLLIFASAIIFRRWANLAPMGNRVHHLHLIETVRLSPKQSIHLVSIGDQKILIGATDQSIALITPIEGSLNLAPLEAPPPQTGSDFASLLQAFNFQPSVSSEQGKK